MNSIAISLNRFGSIVEELGTIVEEVRQELLTKLDVVKEEIREELRNEFYEDNRELMERLKRLERYQQPQYEENSSSLSSSSSASLSSEVSLSSSSASSLSSSSASSLSSEVSLSSAAVSLSSEVSLSSSAASLSSSSSDASTEPRMDTKKKRRKLPNFYIEQDSYTPYEISRLNSFVLCVEFSRLKLDGKTTMYCNHCKKHTPFTNWQASVRSRCMKNGLSSDTVIPKTCDKQQAVNAIANAINNRVYPKLRDTKISAERKQLWSKWREMMFAKLGMKIRPYKY